MVILFSQCDSHQSHQNFTEDKQVVKQEAKSHKQIQGFSLEKYQIDSSKVKSGESFSEILQHLNVSYEKIHKIGEDFKSVYDILNLHRASSP